MAVERLLRADADRNSQSGSRNLGWCNNRLPILDLCSTNEQLGILLPVKMAAENDVYTLHYFPFSLYSLMVRFALVVGRRLNPETAPKVEIKLVNLHREENFSEQYLTLVNSKGQVSLFIRSLPARETYHERGMQQPWLY